jgi:hypothetical protein
MEAPDRILAHDCGSAVDADGGLGDPNRHFAGDKLQLRRGRTVDRPLIETLGAA